jgi:putative redox protein
MARSQPVEMRWKQEGLLFEGVAPNGTIDAASWLDEPGNGPTPMQLLALSLAACTAMDVLSILVKMRQPVEEFAVEVSGERAEDHPKRFLSLDVTYRLKGALDEKKVQRAIQLSETKYCSVENTLRAGVPISSSYLIER